MGQLCPNENDSEYLGLILPEYLAKINGNWLFLALIFEKLIEIAKYYDWESIFRGSHKKLASFSPNAAKNGDICFLAGCNAASKIKWVSMNLKSFS